MEAIAIDALSILLQAYGITPEDFDRVRIADFLELHPELVPAIKGFSSNQEKCEDFTNAETARSE